MANNNVEYENELVQLQLEIWNNIKNKNEDSKLDNQPIPFSLKEINQTVYLNPDETYGFKPEDIDTTDLRNKQQLIEYLKWRKIEDESINSCKDKLKELDVELTDRTKKRFDHFDAYALSGGTETILLEFKNRPNVTCNQYDSVMVDMAKAKSLIDIYKKTKYRIFIIYIYKDEKIRVLEFSKWFNDIDDKRICNVKDNVYNSEFFRDKTYLYFRNDKTILI